MAAKTYYDILEVEPTATAKEIARAHRLVSQKNHPDKVEKLNPEFKELADELQKEINAAYDVLKDSQKRAAYDRTLAQQHQAEANQQQAEEAQRRRGAEERAAEEQRRREEQPRQWENVRWDTPHNQQEKEMKRWRENQKRAEPQGPSLLWSALVAIFITTILVAIYVEVIYWISSR
jgi:curved DNA-binding protein CbpA